MTRVDIEGYWVLLSPVGQERSERVRGSLISTSSGTTIDAGTIDVPEPLELQAHTQGLLTPAFLLSPQQPIYALPALHCSAGDRVSIRPEPQEGTQ